MSPPDRQVPWLAVTGTNGKTTTVGMLESMLTAAGLTTTAVGNVGRPIVEAVLDEVAYDVLAVELSSFQLHWTHSLSLHSAAVLNVAPDHLEWYADEAAWPVGADGPMAAYTADKARIYERVQASCVYNVADPVTPVSYTHLDVYKRQVQVQAIDAGNVAEEAADQITVARQLPAFRGEITDRNGEVLAMTADTVKVIADAKMIRTNGRMNADMTAKDQQVAATAPQQLADLLVRFLGGTADDYLPKLRATGKSESYQQIAKKVPASTYRELAQAVSDAGLVGLSSESSPTRVYPNGYLASNILGLSLIHI